ncbi:MAG: hypothetical protein KBD56_00950 [Candidatus Eisenbacteria bacterium]|nr:hypothetical protein [Candidatus Eisenbacteria bacterium]
MHEAGNPGGAPAVQNLLQPIPGILIGLGGTGGEILLRIRKKFYDLSSTFGLDEWPIVQYLYIDTDAADKDLKDENQKYYKLNQDDFYPATLENYRIFTDKLQDFPSLRKWWYEDQSPLKSTALNTGAGQIRGYARLAVWKHADIIQQRISQLVNQARDPAATARMAQRGITVDNGRAWVYVVASLAGGTGSGAFLDIGYLLRDLNLNGVETMAFLVMPSAFDYLPGAHDRLKANAYASLMELEYYENLEVFAKAFNDQWANHRPPQAITQTPFTRVFLIDGKNLMHQTVSGREAREGLFDLVADHIFLDYSISGFGTQKRSTYANQDQHLNAKYPYEHRDPNDSARLLLREVFSTGYQTFGLSKIYLPIERIKKSASYYLWAETFGLLAGTVTMDNSRVVADRILAEGGLPMFIGERTMSGEIHSVDDFREALLKSSKAGETLLDTLKDSVERIRRNAREGQQKSLSRNAYLKQQIEAYEHQLLIQPSTDSETFKEWGDLYRQMEINRRAYLDALATASEQIARQYTEDANRGVQFAIDILEDMKRRLTSPVDGYTLRWKTDLDTINEKLHAARQSYNNRLLQLAEHERWTFFDAPLLKPITVREGIDRVCRASAKVLTLTAEQRFLENAIAVAEATAENFDKLIGHVKEVKQCLLDMSTALNARAVDFAQEKVTSMNLCPYDPADVRAMYMPRALWNNWQAGGKNLAPECLAKTGPRLRTIHYRWAQNPQEPLSIYDLPTAVDRVGKDTIGTVLARATLDIFDPLEKINVISVMNMRWTDANVRRANIEAVIKRSMPWFERSPNFVENAHNEYFVSSYKMEPGPEYQEFESIVQNAISANMPPMVHDPSSVPYVVLFFTQIAGFPLCFSSALRDLSHAYKESMRGGHDRLHTSKEEWKFPWIDKMETDELNRQRQALELFLVGLALGVIGVTSQVVAGGGSTRDIYHYQSPEYGVIVHKQLGMLRGAVLKIGADSDVANEIQRQIEDRLGKLEQHSQLEKAVAVIRTYFMDQGPYARRQVGRGEGIQEIVPLEFRVLEDFFKTKFKKFGEISLDPVLAQIDSFSEICSDKKHRTLSPAFCKRNGLDLTIGGQPA